jgi:hypothetical protein
MCYVLIDASNRYKLVHFKESKVLPLIFFKTYPLTIMVLNEIGHYL